MNARDAEEYDAIVGLAGPLEPACGRVVSRDRDGSLVAEQCEEGGQVSSWAKQDARRLELSGLYREVYLVAHLPKEGVIALFEIRAGRLLRTERRRPVRPELRTRKSALA